MKIFVTVRFGGKVHTDDEKEFVGLTDEQIITLYSDKINKELAEELGCDIAECIKFEIIRD